MTYEITSHADFPSWLIFDDSSNTFELTSGSEEGEYTVDITCSFENTEVTSTQEIVVFLRVNNPPEWAAGFEDQEVNVGESMVYKTPKYEDEDALDIFIETISVPDFVTYTSTSDGSQISFTIAPDSNDQAGDHTLSVEVQDSDSAEAGYQNTISDSLTITVVAEEEDTSETGGFVFEFDWDSLFAQ